MECKVQRRRHLDDLARTGLESLLRILEPMVRRANYVSKWKRRLRMDGWMSFISLGWIPCPWSFGDKISLTCPEANAQFISTNAKITKKKRLKVLPWRQLRKSGRFLFPQKLLARVPNLKWLSQSVHSHGAVWRSKESGARKTKS